MSQANTTRFMRIEGARPTHSTSGKASKPLVPAGFGMCVNGVPIPGDSLGAGLSMRQEKYNFAVFQIRESQDFKRMRPRADVSPWIST